MEILEDRLRVLNVQIIQRLQGTSMLISQDVKGGVTFRREYRVFGIIEAAVTVIIKT